MDRCATMITCSLCDFQAFSKGNLTFHLNSVHFKDKEYMCRLCHFKTAYKGALTRHVNSVHLRTGNNKECPICGYVTSSLLNLNSHLSASHHLEIATAFARPSGSKSNPKNDQQSSKTTTETTTKSDPEPDPDPDPLHSERAEDLSRRAMPAPALIKEEELMRRYTNFTQLNLLYRELNSQAQVNGAAAAATMLARSRADLIVNHNRNRLAVAVAASQQGIRDPSGTPPPSPPPPNTVAPPSSLPPHSSHIGHTRHHPYLNPSPDVQLQCKLCPFRAATAAYLRNHLRTIHLDEVHTLCCPMCEYTSDRKEDIENHLDLEHVQAFKACGPKTKVLTHD